MVSYKKMSVKISNIVLWIRVVLNGGLALWEHVHMEYLSNIRVFSVFNLPFDKDGSKNQC